MNKLFLTDEPVSIFINRIKQFFYVVGTVVQKLRYFLKGYGPTVVYVEVGEGLLEMLFWYMLCRVYSCNQKLRKIYLAWTVGVDIVEYFLNPFVLFVDKGGILLQGIPYFINLYDPIFIFVEFLEVIDEEAPLLAGEQLGDDVGVDNSLKLISELYSQVRYFEVLKSVNDFTFRFLFHNVIGSVDHPRVL